MKEAESSLVRYFATRYRGRTTLMVVLLAIAGLMEGLGFIAILPVLQVAIDGVADQGRLSQAVMDAVRFLGLDPKLPVLLGILVAFMTAKSLVLVGAYQQVGFIVAQVAMDLRLRLVRAVARASWTHVLRYPTGYITNAVSSEAHRSANAYQEFCTAVADLAQVLIYIALVLMISWQTATVALLAGAFIMFVLKGFVERKRVAGYEQTDLMRGILARMTDVLPGLKPLKAMGRDGYLLPILETDTRRYFEAQRRHIMANAVLYRAREPILVAVMALGLWGTLTLTAVPFAEIMVMTLLFYRTVSGIVNIQQRWSIVLDGESAFKSMMEHIHHAEARRETWAGHREPPPLAEALELRSVSFAYGDNQVLDGVDLTLRAGRFVVLTGPSGGGKSTITDLITGLLRPDSGSVRIDGLDLAELDMQGWRSQIGYVPQELQLISDTIRRNVTLGDQSLTDEAVERAVRSAGAWDFIQELPGGLDERVGEGGITLSGGQRQRVSIARALIGQPHLLVLDEPTTALDARSEEEVLDSISSLKGRLTLLAVSHQPALHAIADELWELRDRKVRVQTPDTTLGRHQ